MAAVTISSDFRAPKRKSLTTFAFSLSIHHEVTGPDAMILGFLIFSFKLAVSLSSFALIKRLFSCYSLSAIRMNSSTCLMLSMFLLHVLITAYNSSSPAFLMMCSVYRLNKQGYSRQPCPSFSILNQSVPSPVAIILIIFWQLLWFPSAPLFSYLLPRVLVMFGSVMLRFFSHSFCVFIKFFPVAIVRLK